MTRRATEIRCTSRTGSSYTPHPDNTGECPEHSHGSGGHHPPSNRWRGQGGTPLMVRAAIAAEEEYKDTLYPGREARAPARTPNHPSNGKRYQIDYYSFHGHVTSKPVLDGLLPVHPPSFLVLRECGQGRVILPLVVGHSSQARFTNVPATLRASTLMMMKYFRIRDASVDRSIISTGPAAQSSSCSIRCQAT